MRLYLLSALSWSMLVHIEPCFDIFISHYKAQSLSQKVIMENRIEETYIRQFLESEYDPIRYEYLYGSVDTLYSNIIVTLSLRINDNDAVVDPLVDPPKEIDPDFGLSEIVVTTYDLEGNKIDQIYIGKWVDGYSPSYCSKWEIDGCEIHDLTIGPFTTLPTTTEAVTSHYKIELDGQILKNKVVKEEIQFSESELNDFLGF